MEFLLPNKFNSLQLQKELKNAGVILKDIPQINNGKLVLEVAKKDETKTQAIVETHVGFDNSAEIQAQRQAVLDRLGLTDDELKVLLG